MAAPRVARVVLGGCSQWLCQDKASSTWGVASLSTLHTTSRASQVVSEGDPSLAQGGPVFRSVLMEVGGLSLASLAPAGSLS